MAEFINAEANGAKDEASDQIVLRLYGPKDGTRAIEGLTLASAKKLKAALGAAILKIERAKL